MRTVVVGSGNVAWGLCTTLVRTGNAPVQVFARDRSKAGELALACGCMAGSEPHELAPADLYVLAVADKAIADVSRSLAFGDGVVAHTAGSVPIDVLEVPAAQRAVIYPLQTFTKGREPDLRQTPFFIEGGGRALEAAREFSELLSAKVLEADSARRAVLHTAAVFASNFTNYMYLAAKELAAESGFGFDVLRPLIVEVAAKATHTGDPAASQTGPASRGDRATMESHRRLLADKPGLLKLYDEISEQIWEISRKTSQK